MTWNAIGRDTDSKPFSSILLPFLETVQLHFITRSTSSTFSFSFFLNHHISCECPPNFTNTTKAKG